MTSWLPRHGNYLFLLPWIAFVPWYGMLVAMLACWAGQGHPIYWFMHQEQFPLYISDIGATNLRPLFISCAGWQGLGYFLCLIADYYQRGGGPHWIHRGSPREGRRMPAWFGPHEGNLLIAAAFIGGGGEIGLLMCSIFSTALYHRVHISMVGVFVALMFISVCCHSAAYFLMGKHYALVHPLAADTTQPTFDELRWNQWTGHVWNKFTISATAKMVWLTLAVIWAICFGAIEDNSKSACFEWLLAFWFGVLFIILSIDFYLGANYRYSKYFSTIPHSKLAQYEALSSMLPQGTDAEDGEKSLSASSLGGGCSSATQV
ncbi:Frag1/DRAM/Sfk1 family protein KNAG_0M02250 [Huiozyma naganishii CBS 8797]|uniref:CWH43-like N-terminal domain-containing protein n=1 Tax=Huiozyma naganishii (strain ATCC MYA-139 / BCRC 22969 / CBS 8797 / KCTC 17520 / NBRC 10181 / NCYC 3082 / Yp74L-3) TaxID=1071383 RepID=J7RT13_HUIN7|nr:hypothetical protein KNAG_0M02250 [Kazachstania naganishii CBS 8797]CCK73078.1 hypothetical protein KNAG_0M02250 [Kazachstania naganishii CBS 8797]